MSRSQIGWIETGDYLTVVVNGKPISVRKGTTKYDNIKALLENASLHGGDVEKYLSPEQMILSFIEEDDSIRVDIDEGKAYHKGEDGEYPLPETLTKKLVEFAHNSYPWKAFSKFLDNIAKNPNEDSRNDLYTYMEHNHFPITEDGCFLAYKYVSKCDDGHFYDSYSKTFLNNPGSVVKMDRDSCDPDRNNTCSHGLHVAAYQYAINYGGINAVIVEVKVNPKDVVAVPIDYNSQKMRVCEYTVIRVGDKECSDSYYNSEFVTKGNISDEDEELNGCCVDISDEDEELNGCYVDIRGMSVEQIEQEVWDLIEDKPRDYYPLYAPKDVDVIKTSINLLESYGYEVLYDEEQIEEKKSSSSKGIIDLSYLTASETVSLVKNKTGRNILDFPEQIKSKRTIIRRAQYELENAGYSVNY